MSSGPVKLSRKTRIDYVADFETTTDPTDCRVWSWGMVRVDNAEIENVELGLDMDSFIERAQKHNSKIYFHNLRFDGVFLLDWLFNNGYEYTEEKISLPAGTFKAVISGMGGKFYSLTIRWKNGKTAEFWDSAKKLPMTVQRVGDSFELGETKGEIDYHKPRPVGYIPTEEENDYQRRDVVIIAKAIALQNEQGLKKMTVASDAMTEFKNVFGKKLFERMFPVLPDALDAELRQSYRGGFTYAAPRFQKEVQKKRGLVLDVNSLYPHIMHSRLLPYGEPTYFRGYGEPTAERPLTIFQVTFTAKLKRNHIPCIQVKNHSVFGSAEYLSSITEPVQLWVTSVDWELWNEHYDIEVLSYDGGWAFKGVQGIFDAYIEKWMNIKANSTGGLREIAKLMLNSLYGKFGSNPDVTGKIPFMEDSVVKFRMGPKETRSPVYTAMASFITAEARSLTIRAAQANYWTFAYADTDSLHLLTDTIPEALEVHPSKLGAWKLEYHFEEALYWRAKFYMEKDVTHPSGAKADYVNHIAGLPPHVAALLRFDDVVTGREIDQAWFTARSADPDKSGKVEPRNVPGGVVLLPKRWTVN